MDKKFLGALIQKLQKRLLKEVERSDYQFRNTYDELLRLYANNEGTLFVIRATTPTIKYSKYYDVLKQLQEITGLDRKEAIYAMAGSMAITLTENQKLIMDDIFSQSGFELRYIDEL